MSELASLLGVEFKAAAALRSQAGVLCSQQAFQGLWDTIEYLEELPQAGSIGSARLELEKLLTLLVRSGVLFHEGHFEHDGVPHPSFRLSFLPVDDGLDQTSRSGLEPSAVSLKLSVVKDPNPGIGLFLEFEFKFDEEVSAFGFVSNSFNGRLFHVPGNLKASYLRVRQNTGIVMGQKIVEVVREFNLAAKSSFAWNTCFVTRPEGHFREV